MDHTPSAPSDDETAAMARLQEIEQELAAAWVNGDRATIERLIAPDWQVTHVAGQRLTRPEALHEIFDKGTSKIESIVTDDVSVRLFGEVAVVTGRTRARSTQSGKPYVILVRFTDVFVRRGGDWQAVASHASPLPP